jgi:hypothetical protein
MGDGVNCCRPNSVLTNGACQCKAGYTWVDPACGEGAEALPFGFGTLQLCQHEPVLALPVRAFVTRITHFQLFFPTSHSSANPLPCALDSDCVHSRQTAPRARPTRPPPARRSLVTERYATDAKKRAVVGDVDFGQDGVSAYWVGELPIRRAILRGSGRETPTEALAGYETVNPLRAAPARLAGFPPILIEVRGSSRMRLELGPWLGSGLARGLRGRALQRLGKRGRPCLATNCSR